MEAERLYALALALVPDEDVAGDLFMISRTEADLRKRSASWRAAHGLEAAPSDLEPVELTADQVQHARHLARRRGLRLRLHRTLWACGWAAALLLLVGLRSYTMRPQPGNQSESWELAPVFALEPASRSDRVGGMQFEVYRIEATPDTVIAYWGIRGPETTVRAVLSAADVDPVLAADEITYASTSQRRLAGRNRIVGRSTFQVMAPSLTVASLQITQVAGVPVDWRVSAHLVAAPANPEQVSIIGVNELVPVLGQNRLEVQSVTVGRNYTSVRYKATGPWANTGPSQRIGLRANGRWVAWRNTWRSPTDNGAVDEAIFEALPEGTGSITVVISPSGFHTAEVMVDQQGSIPDQVAQLGPWRRDGNTLEAPLLLTDTFAILDDAGFLLDAQNRRFAVILMTDSDGQLIVRGWESVDGFEPVALITNVTRYIPGPELNIDL